MERFKKYLEYIKNAGDGATVENFKDDWEPIGSNTLDEMWIEGLIEIVDDKILLTEKVAKK